MRLVLEDMCEEWEGSFLFAEGVAAGLTMC
jgi:hypothetical protein